MLALPEKFEPGLRRLQGAARLPLCVVGDSEAVQRLPFAAPVLYLAKDGERLLQQPCGPRGIARRQLAQRDVGKGVRLDLAFTNLTRDGEALREILRRFVPLAPSQMAPAEVAKAESLVVPVSDFAVYSQRLLVQSDGARGVACGR